MGGRRVFDWALEIRVVPATRPLDEKAHTKPKQAAEDWLHGTADGCAGPQPADATATAGIGRTASA